jgi:hypothetical protein
METKQTAVEWLQDQIIKIVNGTCQISEIQIFEQAKEMEQLQKETEYRRGFQDGKQYYKEEYGNKR